MDEYVGQKTPLQSKKFVAFLVGEITWKVILGVVLVLGIKEGAIDVFVGSIALAIVIIAGAIEALYIGGQAGLDKYTRIAQIAANAGHSFSMKDIGTSHAPTPTPCPPPTSNPKSGLSPDEDTDERG